MLVYMYDVYGLYVCMVWMAYTVMRHIKYKRRSEQASTVCRLAGWRVLYCAHRIAGFGNASKCLGFQALVNSAGGCLYVLLHLSPVLEWTHVREGECTPSGGDAIPLTPSASPVAPWSMRDAGSGM